MSEQYGLTKVQAELLHIMEAFMEGKTEYELPDTIDGKEIEELYRLSAVHKIASIVYEMIWRAPQLSGEESALLAMRWKQMALRDVMMQVQRTEGFLRLYRRLCDNGLKPLVVKGIVCRNLYAKPDYRVSGDEDVLLRPEEFEACDRIMREEGFQRKELPAEGLPHEVPYLNSKNGVYIELHLSLFPEESGAYGHLNREFVGVHDRCICEKIQGTKVWTLHPTDHLYYLICHSFKHFLHSGFGIRQVSDIMMLAKHYGEQIDWAYIAGRLKELRMDMFFCGLLQIGERYLGMSGKEIGISDEITWPGTDCSALLMDLLDSGIFGDSSMERKHSSNMTLAAVKKGKKDTVASLGSSLFPPISYMKRGYPWLERYPWLLPTAWIMRCIQYLKRGKHGSRLGNEEENSVEIGMNRVELLRQYHIID